MSPIRIETRTDCSLSRLRQMSLRDELVGLLADTRAVCAAYHQRPRQMLGRWVLATVRCFVWTPRNNNFRKAVFLGFSLVLGILLAGNAAGGWDLNQRVLLSLTLIWGVALGITLGLELERIDVAGASIQFSTDDDGGDS